MHTTNTKNERQFQNYIYIAEALRLHYTQKIYV